MCGPGHPEPNDDLVKAMRVLETRSWEEYVVVTRRLEKEKHLSDIEFVNQNGRGK
jgi:hypothetical protein